MKIKHIYYYWFYKYYSFLERYEQTRWLSQTKAMIIMGVLEIWFIGSLYNYIKVLSLKYPGKFNLSPLYIIIPACIIIVIKWLAFNDEHWKEYIDEFDEFDRSKGNLGTWIVVILTVGIFLNFFYSGTLLRQMYGWPV